MPWSDLDSSLIILEDQRRIVSSEEASVYV